MHQPVSLPACDTMYLMWRCFKQSQSFHFPVAGASVLRSCNTRSMPQSGPIIHGRPDNDAVSVTYQERWCTKESSHNAREAVEIHLPRIQRHM